MDKRDEGDCRGRGIGDRGLTKTHTSVIWIMTNNSLNILYLKLLQMKYILMLFENSLQDVQDLRG